MSTKLINLSILVVCWSVLLCACVKQKTNMQAFHKETVSTSSIAQADTSAATAPGSLPVEKTIMAVTVHTSSDMPFTMHMGIFRNPIFIGKVYFRGGRQLHKGISVALHAFAAREILKRDPKKIYMITKPVEVMRNILLKSLPKASIFIGDNIWWKDENERQFDSRISRVCLAYASMKIRAEYPPKEVEVRIEEEKNRLLKDFEKKRSYWKDVQAKYTARIILKETSNSEYDWDILDKEGASRLVTFNKKTHGWVYEIFPISLDPYVVVDLKQLADLYGNQRL